MVAEGPWGLHTPYDGLSVPATGEGGSGTIFFLDISLAERVGPNGSPMQLQPILPVLKSQLPDASNLQSHLIVVLVCKCKEVHAIEI